MDEFEAIGFGGLDLGEKNYSLTLQKVPDWHVSTSAPSCYYCLPTVLQLRAVKRTTPTWTDFLSTGFIRTDCDVTSQHSPRKLNLVLLRVTSPSRHYAQVERDRGLSHHLDGTPSL